MFDSTLKGSISPCSLRSSGTNDIPAALASAGSLILTGFPSIRISWPKVLSAPKIARTISVLPAPPVRQSPVFHPFFSLKETSFIFLYLLSVLPSVFHRHFSDAREIHFQLTGRPSWQSFHPWLSLRSVLYL